MPDDLEIIRGDTPTIRLGPIRREGAIVDLDGASAALTARLEVDADDPPTFQKAGTPATIEEAADGFDFTLAAADTEDLTPGDRLVFDAQVVEADGTKTTYPKRGPGTMLILPDVNRG